MNTMSTAPADGTVIEALFEGEWFLVYWTDTADDMSPHGTPGWAREDDRLLMVELESWRELPADQERVIDEEGDRALAAAADSDARGADEAQERRDRRRAARAATARNREALEGRYAALTGRAAPQMTVRALRAEVRDLDRADSFHRLEKVLSELR